MTENNEKIIKIIGIGAVLIFLTITVKGIFKAVILGNNFPWTTFFLIGIIIFFLLSYIFFSLWIYQDCKIRKEDGILWVVVMWLTSPLIGLLIYFLKRPAPKTRCAFCGHFISIKANYCENCGELSEKEGAFSMTKKNSRHLNYLIAGGICLLLMLGNLTGFIVQAAVGDNSNPTRSTWNPGIITFNMESHLNNQWTIKFKSASKGYVKQVKMTLKQPETEVLSADISCDKIPENCSLILWLVQDDIEKSFDVTRLSAPLEIPLEDFDKGKLTVQLEINGVRDVTGKITLK